MQGLGRLKKPPPIISIFGPGPPVPDSQLLCILRPLSFRNRCFLQGQFVSLLPNTPTWRTRVPLLVWAITFDLSCKGDPTSS